MKNNSCLCQLILSATLYSFSYDGNGNITSDDSRSFTYGSYDKATKISKGSNSSTMYYGVDRELYFKTDSRVEQGKSTTYQTTYLGNYEKVVRSGGAGALTEHKYYVGGDIVVTHRSNGSQSSYYLHKDHQGSVVAVTDQNGKVVSQAIYDPYGKRHSIYVDSLMANFTVPEPTERGYTGHKELKGLDIIHMGGRIYDPTLGRFMQADPFIQAPKNSQNYNRYSYVLNNPMSYTDPSGYFFEKIFREFGRFFKQYGRMVVAIGMMFIPGVGQLAAASMWSAAALGAASGYIATGTIRGAIVGAFSAGLGGGEFITNGIVGGVASAAMGGEFGHGFISAALGAAIGGQIKGINNGVGRVLASAVVGGTISSLTGGKFANGAFGAAFAAMLSQFGNGVASTNEGVGEPDAKGAQTALDKLKADKKINTAKYFDTPDDAAKEILNLVSPVSDEFNIEIGGSIVRDRLGYRYTNPHLGNAVSVHLADGYDGYHTHPNEYQMFSNRFNAAKGDGDVGWMNREANKGVTLYLGTQIGGKVYIGSCTATTCFASPWETPANKVLQ